MNKTSFSVICGIILTILPLSAADNTAYIKHSSGLILGNSGGKAVIFDRTDSRAVAVTMTETTDGWLNISVPDGNGTPQYLYKTGAWNTSFGTSSNIDEAKFRIEGDIEGYVRIVCKANDRCLGTDDNTSGSNVYSDKDGGDIKHQWFVTADPEAEPDLTVTRYVIDAENTRQTTEGWGVSLCWWANMCGKWEDRKIDRIIDWLVSPTGLNYNIFRYNIGGGDDPNNTHCTPHHMGNGKGLRAEMEGFKDSTDDQYHWDRDEAQRKIMLKIKEKRPDAIFEAFSNTPPWYMTYSGCCSGNEDGAKDNLKPEYYEEFAHYLVDVCKHYKDEYGIEFRTLEPFNESNTNYWYCNGVQEGCHFDFSSQIDFIKILHPILQESGLSTVISASDETAVWPAICGFNEYRDAGILDLIGQWNTHTYWGNNNDRKTYNQLVRPTGSRLWMSETGAGGNGLEGNLNMAQRLIDDVRYIEPDAWVDWQYMEENNDQWCLIKGSFENQTAQKVKNFYVRQHFSKFIKPGYTFIGTDNEQTLVAISPAADTLVVATVNTLPMEKTLVATLRHFTPGTEIESYITNETNILRKVTLGEIDSEGRLTYTIPEMSICTIVIPCGDQQGIADHIADDIKWTISDSTLTVDSVKPCKVQVYTPSGQLVYNGTSGSKIRLSAGIYLLNAQQGTRRLSSTIAVK